MTTVEEHGFQPGPFAIIEIDSLDISQWSPDPQGIDPPTQVHMTISIKGLEDLPPLAVRVKSAETIGLLIEQLTRHRKEVWPHASEPRP